MCDILARENFSSRRCNQLLQKCSQNVRDHTFCLPLCLKGKHASHQLTPCCMSIEQEPALLLPLFDAMIHVYGTQSVHNYTVVLGHLERMGDGRAADSLLEEMLEAGCYPNAQTYGVRFRACIQINYSQRAWKLFKELKELNVDPSPAMFTSLIMALSKGARWKESMSVLRDMPRLGVEPNEVHYGAVIGVCAKAGQWQKALKVKKDMEFNGYKPNLVAYASLINACERGNNVEVAKRLFIEMNQRGVQPDVQTYNSLLRALGKALDVTRVEQLFAHMQRDGPTPDMVTWTALIAAYVRSSMVRLAPCRWIHSCMERNDLRPWQHTECSLMLQGLEAFSAWERMQETELEYKPSQWTLACNATIRACARSDLTDCARAVLDKLLLSGAEPTIASFQPLVKALREKDDPAAEEVYELQQRYGCVREMPSMVSLESLTKPQPQAESPLGSLVKEGHEAPLHLLQDAVESATGDEEMTEGGHGSASLAVHAEDGMPDTRADRESAHLVFQTLIYETPQALRPSRAPEASMYPARARVP
eukprot:scaffold3036_cov414-Prasinococcus_capsulatus_cf.AAC.7